MPGVILSSLADADTAEILADLGAKAGATVAARYNSDFDNVYLRLTAFPAIGAPRPKLGADIRICPVLPYTIIYEYSPRADEVIIMRVLHGKRRITRKLLSGD